MLAFVLDFAVLHDDDAVHLHDSGQAMGDGDDGFALHEFGARILNYSFGLGVEDLLSLYINNILC